jgi:hypothetical protein
MTFLSILTASVSMFRATLVLALTVLVTSVSTRSRPWSLARQIISGTILGGFPAVLLFDSARRQNPMSGVYFLLAGLVVGIVAGAFGTVVGVGRTESCRRPTMAGVGAALGSLTGTSFACAIVYSPGRDFLTEMVALIVAAAFVGAFATAGYRILGGGLAGSRQVPPDAGGDADGRHRKP